MCPRSDGASTGYSSSVTEWLCENESFHSGCGRQRRRGILVLDCIPSLVDYSRFNLGQYDSILDQPSFFLDRAEGSKPR